MIYLDNAATTLPCAQAIDATHEILCNTPGNPSSLYKLGLAAENVIAHARTVLAKALGCMPQEVLFTSGATESNNTAIFGVLDKNPRLGKKIITTAIEHASVHEVFNVLEQKGYEVIKLLPQADGSFDPAAFADAVDEQTALVSVMLVNNETGQRLPVEQIAQAVKEKNTKTLVHTDATQGFCKIPFCFKRTAVDLVSVSGHKVYAPKGVGALVVKKGVRISPLLHGGGQESGLRGGTENVAGIHAFAAAVEATFPNIEANLVHYTQLKAQFLQAIAGCDDIALNEPPDALPYTINLSVRGVKSEIMLHFLESRDIYVSSGSACKKGKRSHVLLAMGLNDARADTAIRLSFCPQTTLQDVMCVADAILQGAQTLMKLK